MASNASHHRRTAPKAYQGTDQEFLVACERAKVSPTNRQYRRFLQGRGQARLALREHQQVLAYNKATAAAQGNLADWRDMVNSIV